MDVESFASEENLEKNSDPIEAVVVSVPKQLSFPFPFWIQVSSSFRFYAFLVLKPFLDVSYFTLNTPFRITKTKNDGYVIHSNIVQTILSTFFMVSGIIYRLLQLKDMYQEKSQMDHRDKVKKTLDCRRCRSPFVVWNILAEEKLVC